MSLRGSMRSLGVVSSSTAGSRVLGLARDILTAASLGIGMVNSAFLYAFTLPNLFRRLLGEGALTSALIPSLVKAKTEGGDQAVFRLLNGVLSYLTVVLLLLALLGLGVFFLLPSLFPEVERIELVAEYGMILFPYLILVCQAAAFAAFLQVFQRFALAALSPVWLNLSMLLCLVLAWLWVPEPEARAWWLCWAVLVGGVFQVALPVCQSWKLGWRPQFHLGRDHDLMEVWKLFVPGLLGAAIFQINILVSRSLALAVEPGGVAYLYLANRLMELPLGLIAIAVSTVAFPAISVAFSRGEQGGAVARYRESVKLVLCLMIPSAVGLIILAEPIMRVLFLYGAVTEENLARTVPILQVFALGLPFYSLATLATRVFHAQRDTRTPVKVAALAFVLNLVGSLILMRPYGVLGLAWANLVSIVIQSLILEGLWRRQMGPVMGIRWEGELGRPLLAVILMGAVLLGGKSLLFATSMEVTLISWWLILVGIPLGVAAYLAGLILFRAPEGKMIGMMLLRVASRLERARKGINFIKGNRMLVGLILLLLLAFVYPEPGSKGGILYADYTTTIGVILIFLIQGISVNRDQWVKGLADWRLHLFVQLFLFLVFPLVCGMLLWPLRGHMNESLWMGMVFFTLLPSTVATAVVFTSKANGAVSGALFNCLLSNFLGVFLVPTGIAFILDSGAGDFPYQNTLIKLFLMVGIPILVGQLISKKLENWTQCHRIGLRSTLEYIVLFTAYCAFSESVKQKSWAGLEWLDGVIGIIGVLVILFLIRGLLVVLLKASRFNVEQKKAAYFCSAQKTIALGIPMGYFIFSDYSGVGLILFPLIIYHFCQLILDGGVASRWANWNQS